MIARYRHAINKVNLTTTFEPSRVPHSDRSLPALLLRLPLNPVHLQFPGSPTHKDEPEWVLRMGADGKKVWRPTEEHEELLEGEEKPVWVLRRGTDGKKVWRPLEEHEEFLEGERLETAAEAAARCAASTLWARATICSKAAVQLCEQARLESGVPADDADIKTEHKRTKDGFLATRVVVSKQGGALNKLEVVHIMSNYDVFGSS